MIEKGQFGVSIGMALFTIVQLVSGNDIAAAIVFGCWGLGALIDLSNRGKQ